MRAARLQMRAPSLRRASGNGEEHLSLPADLLIGPDGRVLATRYGTHVDDQWSDDELLDLAARQNPGTPGPRQERS